MCHLKPHNVKLTVKFFFSGVLLSLIISSSLCFSAPKLRTHDHAAILYSFMTLTTPTHLAAFNSHGSRIMPPVCQSLVRPSIQTMNRTTGAIITMLPQSFILIKHSVLCWTGKDPYTPGIEKVVPRNLINVWLFPNGLQRFWLHRRDCYDAMTQNQNNCAETHFGGRDVNAFVSPLAAIARALSLTSGGRTVLKKGTRRFWPRLWSLSFTDAYMRKLTVLAKLWVLQ